MAQNKPIHGVRVAATAAGGALIIRSQQYWKNETTVAYRLNNHGRQAESYYATYREFKQGVFGSVVAAIFPDLPPGTYDVLWTEQSDFQKTTTVHPGSVAEVSFP